MVGYNTADDAGVVKLTDEIALIQTVDVFTPVVDDPYTYGAVAAANCISDVYAMGGEPICALNVVGFPRGKLDIMVLADILRGAHDKSKEAGISIVGGHSINDGELKYGLSVTGTVHPAKIIANAGARPGDRIFLTKPLGSGVISTAVRAGKMTDEEAGECVEWMTKLNRAAAEAMIAAQAHAATDVTGFGLMGHLWEMAAASGVEIALYSAKVPMMDKTFECIALGTVPGGSYGNKSFLEDKAVYAEGVSEEMRIALNDAQTSGGLLIAVAPEKVDIFIEECEKREENCAVEVAEVIEGKPGRLNVR